MSFSDAVPINVQQELETAGPYLNGQAAEISGELHRLAQYLDQLPEIWQGAASGYYQGLQAEWNVAAEGLFGPEGVLGQIARAMNVNWANYSDAEWANSQTWNHH
ncbi:MULTISPECIES: WXG100 family type VII secretion target [Streptomyces]|uniref:WXG100 family type VII secretion target n=1 Tax=Streptomyces fildesensis TaxID=375757 RepID=A0ABW8C8Q1_9ACTN|nr:MULTISPECIES: WXG100 family type VII secretion target [unclassified Streptomyces]MCM2417774.1 WXG100 family type VII secretion target [Streptomyces sp. RKAG293]MCM2430040.1 WXG100 family type VII secretion target [Streptomyces sp. RKAG337]